MPDETETLVAAPDRGEDYAGVALTPPSDDASHLDAASDADIAKLLGEPLPKPAAPVEKKETPAPAKPVAPAKPAAPAAEKKTPLDIAQEKLAKKQARNLDGFSPDEQKLLRHMPNETWAMVEPLLRKAKEANVDVELPKKYAELEKQLNEIKHYRYADHPEAYRLDETYATYAKLGQTVDSIGEHLKQQLAAIRAGAKEYHMPQLDQQGNVVGFQKQAVLPTSADELLMHLQNVTLDKQQIEAEIAKVKQQHAERWTAHTKTLNDIYANNFGKFEKVLKPLADEYLASFPAYFRGTPEAKLMAYSLASGKFIADANASEQAASTVEKVRKQTAASAGPTAEELHTGVAANGDGSIGAQPLTQDQFMRMYYR